MNAVEIEQAVSDLCEARLDVTLRDRFGETAELREWFMLPLQVINEALELLIQAS